MWSLPAETQRALDAAYDEKFHFLFDQLAIGNTAEVTQQHVKPIEQHRPMPADATPAHAAAPDDADLSD
jgi:hypothetical protein